MEQFERLFCSGVGLLVRVNVCPGRDGSSISLGDSVPRSESGSARWQGEVARGRTSRLPCVVVAYLGAVLLGA